MISTGIPVSSKTFSACGLSNSKNSSGIMSPLHLLQPHHSQSMKQDRQSRLPSAPIRRGIRDQHGLPPHTIPFTASAPAAPQAQSCIKKPAYDNASSHRFFILENPLAPPTYQQTPPSELTKAGRKHSFLQHSIPFHTGQSKSRFRQAHSEPVEQVHTDLGHLATRYPTRFLLLQVRDYQL